MSAPARDDDAVEVIRLRHACLQLHHFFLVLGAQAAQWRVLVLGPHGGHHLVGGDAECLHGSQVEFDVDGAARAADQIDRTHTAYVFEPLFEYLLRPLRQLGR